jgi:cytochrome c-type biogenesis protein CcmE
MKKSHIALIGVIALAVAAIVITIGDASTYVGFALADSNPGEKFTVIGQLNRQEPMVYDPASGQFSFHALDKEGRSKQVLYPHPKPQDFARSEEITMKGYTRDSVFVAEEILMKCPSKYADETGVATRNDVYLADTTTQP